MTDPNTLKEKLLVEGKLLGLNLMGFANIERWAHPCARSLQGKLRDEDGAASVPREGQGEEFYPQTIWPWSRTVLVGGVQIFLPVLETTPSNTYSELYNTTNRMLDEAAYRLANLLNTLGYRAFFFPRDGYGDISALVRRPEAAFSQVIAAKYAGLGTIGANHVLLTPEYGPRVRLVSVITDAEIPADPLLEGELCIRCGQCTKNCPVNAFTTNPNKLFNHMDKYRCAKYHQFLRDELRYPCGVCTVVCPVGDDRKVYGAQSVSDAGIEHVRDFGSGYNWKFLKNRRKFIREKHLYKFETLQIHAGQEKPDPATDARAVPIYQTTSYVFEDSAQAAGRFALTTPGNIYTRIMNPTTDIFEQRIAALEKGAAALAVSSGQAAITYAVQNIAGDGDHIIADKQINGDTASLFTHTLADFGINTTFVDGSDPRNFEAAITQETKAVYIETLGIGPAGICFTVDIEKIANIAHRHGIPLIADNTLATPYLLTPADYGADIVIHSTPAFIGGKWADGGVIVDVGRFDWDKNIKFPGLSEPNDSYHGVVFSDVAGRLAYITKARTTLLRDTGAALAPLDAFLLLQGLETLSLRMERHLENTQKVIEFLKIHPQVERVYHLSLPAHRDHALYQKYFPKGALSVVMFELKGDAAGAHRFTEALELAENCAVVGDVETGKKPVIRVAVGTEYAGDIVADLEKGFGAVK